MENVRRVEMETFEAEQIEVHESVTSRIPITLVICKNTGDWVNVDKKNVRTSWKRQKQQFAVIFASMLYFSKLSSIRIILLTDSVETYVELLSTISGWPQHQRRRLHFEMHNIEEERFKEGQLLQWRPCAWTKMYLPEMLEDFDATIYMDSDVLFLGPVEDTWAVFQRMGDVAAIAASAEMWYLEEGNNRPAAGKYGINTGVMFMNLTRLRKISLAENLMLYTDSDPAPRHDQDVLNAFLKYHPHLLHELPARYNFLPSSCQKSAPVCQECLDRGILVMHGADSSFYRFVDAKMKMVFRVLLEVSFNFSASLEQLVQRLEAGLVKLHKENHMYIYMCQHLPHYDLQLMRHARSLLASKISK
ncbi:hypothetical protein HAZT_HAZT003323 [Hyalella azteca]|nr:hypothetical protein HAZT_HAZT003323 [Hyalella azteca]